MIWLHSVRVDDLTFKLFAVAKNTKISKYENTSHHAKICRHLQDKINGMISD